MFSGMNTSDTAARKRAAIYARISLDRKEEAGVQRQEQACRELATLRGYEVVEVFVDNSVSAYSGVERPAYQALLSAIKAGRVDKVLVWHTDRLHRRMEELTEYIKAVSTYSVDTETVMAGSIDLSGATGKMLAQIVTAVSEQESAHKAERIKAAYDQINREGRPVASGHRTFGYIADRTALNESEAAALRHVAGLVLNGGTLYGASKWLNENGYTTTTGRKFYGGAVKDLLINPRLAGFTTMNERDSRGRKLKRNRQIIGRAQWPAIFTEEEHEQLVAVLTDPARVKNMGRGRGRKPEHLGSGIYRCGCPECLGKPDTAAVMYCRNRRERLKGGTEYSKRIYHVKSDTFQSSKGHTSRLADPVDEHVTRALLARLTRPDVIAALQQAKDKTAPDRLTTKRRELTDRIEGLEAQFSAGNLDAAQFGRLNRALLDQIEELEKELEAYAGETAAATAYNAAKDDVRAWWVSAGLEQRRALLDAVATVYIKPERQGNKTFHPDKIVIEWKV